MGKILTHMTMSLDGYIAQLKNIGVDKMVEVYQHCGQQDQPVFLPVFRVIKKGYQADDQKMKGVMDYGL